MNAEEPMIGVFEMLTERLGTVERGMADLRRAALHKDNLRSKSSKTFSGYLHCGIEVQLVKHYDGYVESSHVLVYFPKNYLGPRESAEDEANFVTIFGQDRAAELTALAATYNTSWYSLTCTSVGMDGEGDKLLGAYVTEQMVLRSERDIVAVVDADESMMLCCTSKMNASTNIADILRIALAGHKATGVPLSDESCACVHLYEVEEWQSDLVISMMQGTIQEQRSAWMRMTQSQRERTSGGMHYSHSSMRLFREDINSLTAFQEEEEDEE